MAKYEKFPFLCFAILLLSCRAADSQRFAGDACTMRVSRNPGVCKSIHLCSAAVLAFENEGIRPTRCGFSGGTPIVCCEETATTPPPTPSPTPPRNPPRNPPSDQSSKRVSERKCDEYSSFVRTTLEAIPLVPNAKPLPFQVEKCEFDSTVLIVGGHDAKLGEFPHMAAIGWDTPSGREYKFKCGGSLISEDFVLTAGHCTYINSDEVAGNEPTVVRLGEHNIRLSNDGAQPIDVKISSMILHPSYKPPSKYHDIALLRLENSVKLSTFIRPACLWTQTRIDDDKAAATGWGLTENQGNPSDILQTVVLNIIDKPTCSRFFRQSSKINRGIIDEQICAGDLAGGKDTCQGDSGGPLEISSKKNRCIHYLIGLTSFGIGCGESNSAGVYTRISPYVSWIESQVWPGQ